MILVEQHQEEAEVERLTAAVVMVNSRKRMVPQLTIIIHLFSKSFCHQIMHSHFIWYDILTNFIWPEASDLAAASEERIFIRLSIDAVSVLGYCSDISTLNWTCICGRKEWEECVKKPARKKGRNSSFQNDHILGAAHCTQEATGLQCFRSV